MIDFKKLAIQAKRNGLTKKQTAILLENVKQSLLKCHEPPRTQEELIANTVVALASLLEDGEVVVRVKSDGSNEFEWKAA